MTKEYISLGVVTRLEERKTHYNWRKEPDGSSGCDTVSLGWFIVIRGEGSSSFSIGVGHECPELKPGDTVQLTLTKAP